MYDDNQFLFNNKIVWMISKTESSTTTNAETRLKTSITCI